MNQQFTDQELDDVIKEAEATAPHAEKLKLKREIDTSKFKPLTSQELIETLSLTVKHDDANKLITFLCMLTAFTEDAQFNISFNAPSSTGKSYIPLEDATLFPIDDVKVIGHCSPTAFFHENFEYDKERKGYIVDLARKILIFLDQPHNDLLVRLRPLLSHDKKEIQMKITDKNQKFGMRTKNVFVKGFPSVIFCSAGTKIDEQEMTRMILLSPEISDDKIRDAIHEAALKDSNPQEYLQRLKENTVRTALIDRIEAIRNELVEHIIIPTPDVIEHAFLGKRETLKPRHTRDMKRLISLVKAFALLNLWFRKREGRNIIANDQDIQEALKVWEGIAHCQELNLPPYVYDVYQKVIMPIWQEKNSGKPESERRGLTRQEIMNGHYRIIRSLLPDWKLRQHVYPMLEAAGLVTEEPDPVHAGRKLIIPSVSRDMPTPEHCEVEGGVREELKVESSTHDNITDAL